MNDPTISSKIDFHCLHHFQAVYRDFYAPLCVFARKFLPDQEEDIVNALFAKLWQKKLSFDNSNHCRNYLYKSVYHACLDAFDQESNCKKREQIFVNDQSVTQSAIDELIIENEYRAMVYRGLSALPKAYDNVIRMSYIEGLNNAEISTELNLSMQTVKNQKSKGLKLLRQVLSKQLSFPLLWPLLVLFASCSK